LREFYENPRENGFRLQSLIAYSMVQNYSIGLGSGINFFERSILSSNYVFQRILAEEGEGVLAPVEDNILKCWHQFCIERLKLVPDLVGRLKKLLKKISYIHNFDF
jgi:deoxyadenosine/deoxycytidine kinase